MQVIQGEEGANNEHTEILHGIFGCTAFQEKHWDFIKGKDPVCGSICSLVIHHLHGVFNCKETVDEYANQCVIGFVPLFFLPATEQVLNLPTGWAHR